MPWQMGIQKRGQSTLITKYFSLCKWLSYCVVVPFQPQNIMYLRIGYRTVWGCRQKGSPHGQDNIDKEMTDQKNEIFRKKTR